MQESGENYLETILVLKNRNGHVRSIDIANELSFSKPSVSRAVGILKDSGLVVVDQQGFIEFTDMGQAKAESIYDRHQLLTAYLMDVLGVDAKTAETDACRMEHVLSDKTMQKIREIILKKD